MFAVSAISRTAFRSAPRVARGGHAPVGPWGPYSGGRKRTLLAIASGRSLLLRGEGALRSNKTN
ncbi:hypothetical protein BDK51DRAFT_37431 [Blyttiomyces helicus]|uniref:Uncharacterized protein n=1 Tax=Blyttiomyces helicus TaxID=388810 RepID=A0A4P9WM56_9FUNG|nr:hypothetical protein BDK51DRAFT_37431 [Blyttiomyces helicus]|eukprot:RKO92250.1 hypothetical protein BDK51DRAFT_37431 [Blyttiomyces helicus]